MTTRHAIIALLMFVAAAILTLAIGSVFEQLATSTEEMGQ